MSMSSIFIVVGVVAIGFAMQIVATVIHNNSKKQFEKENPDAAMMIIKDRQFHLLGFTETLQCLTINGQQYPQIMDGFKRGYYLVPGSNVLELQYETQRPGILHKWVRTTYDPQKIEVTAEPKKKYSISYNKKAQQFIFEEVAQAK
ncbi:hypothetical protein DBY21_04120 [Candidatus Gastranaerophilales bacterium]|nr:MAG: hypothetical protein DBY21_04120 [Candidatus Gastranaerophilales bacterium]